jgi:hypothetical protein
MTQPTAEQMAKSLYDNGMSVHHYDLDKATFILENAYPNMGLPDVFPQLAFDVFFELMRLESNKMV